MLAQQAAEHAGRAEELQRELLGTRHELEATRRELDAVAAERAQLLGHVSNFTRELEVFSLLALQVLLYKYWHMRRELDERHVRQQALDQFSSLY